MDRGCTFRSGALASLSKLRDYCWHHNTSNEISFIVGLRQDHFKIDQRLFRGVIDNYIRVHTVYYKLPKNVLGIWSKVNKLLTFRSRTILPTYNDMTIILSTVT